MRSALLAWVALLACAAPGQLSDGTYRDGPIAFRIGRLSAEWQRVHVGEGQLAFHHAGGGTIAANATCEPREDVSLDVLTNHLLFGVENRRDEARVLFALDGRTAMRTHLDGTLDGVPVSLDLVVLKKDGCTYDFDLAATPRIFHLRQPDFEGFFRGFASLGAA